MRHCRWTVVLLLGTSHACPSSSLGGHCPLARLLIVLILWLILDLCQLNCAQIDHLAAPLMHPSCPPPQTLSQDHGHSAACWWLLFSRSAQSSLRPVPRVPIRDMRTLLAEKSCNRLQDGNARIVVRHAMLSVLHCSCQRRDISNSVLEGTHLTMWKERTPTDARFRKRPVIL